MLRIAHLSDPHFSHITYNPSQLLSKRWLGNCNLILYRHNVYRTAHLVHVPKLVTDLGVEAVFITGDLSTTSLDEEFAKGRVFVDSFPMPVYVLPGNHDCYTKEAEHKGRFYHYFPAPDLQKKRVQHSPLGKGWHWVALDCAVATALIYSYGQFFPEMERELDAVLEQIPKDQRVIIGNHFPLLTTERPRHDLRGAHALQKILKRHPQVKLYLHGHDHIPARVTDELPLIFNSGSCTHTPGGTFDVIDLFEDRCVVRHFLSHKEAWNVEWERTFSIT